MPSPSSRRRFLQQALFAASPLALADYARPDLASAGEQPALSWAERFAPLEPLLLEGAAAHAVPGISVAVVRGARVVWTRGLGLQDRASGVPVSEGSIFEAASMSKPVFAYAVMQLHERGLLDLDTPLSSYAREPFLEDDPRFERITARQVLAHTSGLPDIRSREHPLALSFDPGARWQYSGEGYAYLQTVVTRLTGRTLSSPCGRYETDLEVCATDIDDYMQSQVLRPLGMRSSGYLWSEAIAASLARPHDEQGQPLPGRRYTGADAARYGAMGGLLTTATDYARFLVACLDTDQAGPLGLRRASLEKMLTPQVSVEEGPGYSISWALGWKIADTAEFGVLASHGGDQSGFHSLAEMSPSRRSGYVILTNGENGWKLIGELAPKLARVVHAGA